MGPYVLMTILYISLAVLVALESSLTGLSVLPWFNGLRWLRIHLITLGTLTEIIFGVLPILVAAKAGLLRPAFRWDIWFTLNGGLIVLLIGIPLVNQPLILAGGVLVFLAATLLLAQLNNLRPKVSTISVNIGRKFYIAGVAYFLVGIVVGTGLWLGWSQILKIAVPLEVHIHANIWGFMSLVFTGLLVDLYPRFAKRPLAWKNSITSIFWMMTAGAFLLILGPWFKSNWLSGLGFVLYLSATIWLLFNIIKPLVGDRQAWSPGMWHLVTSYAWILAPVLVAPLIVFGVLSLPDTGIERIVPQALIYSWLLQLAYALAPYLFRRFFLSEQEATLGGNWLSLITVHLGGIFLWASVFIISYQAQLNGIAYAWWTIATVPIALELWRIVQKKGDLF